MSTTQICEEVVREFGVEETIQREENIKEHVGNQCVGESVRLDASTEGAECSVQPPSQASASTHRAHSILDCLGVSRQVSIPWLRLVD